MSSEFSLSELAIRPLKTEPIEDDTVVTLKVAYIGDKKLIIEELFVKSTLNYPSGRERILAWIKLAWGYFTDDIVGLKTVFGQVSPTSTWIIGGPVYRIKNKYLRKSLSALLGLVTVYFFVFYMLPVFWPLLWLGPYWQVQQIAHDDKLLLRRGKSAITTPFILDPGTEEQMMLRYRPSSMMTTLEQGSPVPNAKIKYVDQFPETKLYRLPRPNEFTWKNDVSLFVKVQSGWNRYHLDSGTGIVHLEL